MRRLKFRLRTLLLATLVVGVIVGVYCERAMRQRNIVNQLLSKQAIAFYTVEDGKPFAKQFVAAKTDFWNHFRYSIKMVVLQPTASEPTDAQIRIVARLPGIDYLYAWPGGVQKGDNQPLMLNADGGLTDQGVDVLINDLNHLRHFGTTSASCSQQRLAEVSGAMTNLELFAVLPHKNSKGKLEITR